MYIFGVWSRLPCSSQHVSSSSSSTRLLSRLDAAYYYIPYTKQYLETSKVFKAHSHLKSQIFRRLNLANAVPINASNGSNLYLYGHILHLHGFIPFIATLLLCTWKQLSHTLQQALWDVPIRSIPTNRIVQFNQQQDPYVQMYTIV